MVSARQQCVTRGRAAAATAVSVRETHSLGGKIVHVRCRNLAALGIIALHIPITEIVGQDDEEVGTRPGSEGRAAQDACQQAIQQWTSPIHDPAALTRFVHAATERAQLKADYDLVVTANLRVALSLESRMRSQGPSPQGVAFTDGRLPPYGLIRDRVEFPGN